MIRTRSFGTTIFGSATACVLACTAPVSRDDTASGPGLTGVTTAPGSGSETTGTHESSPGGSEAESADETGIKFDTPGGEGPGEGEGAGGQGCTKIDFLFVIDSSGSMGDEQQNLATSFPGFIDVIQQTLMAQDYHIMAIDTDSAGFEICTTLCQFFPDCEGVPCDQIPPQDACDNTLGAGKRKSQDGANCGVVGDQRYIVDGQPDVGATFGCMALVGTLGSGDEQAIEAMQAAVGPATNGAGGCNEGFLRDDAILVVTLITDESDGAEQEGEVATAGDPMQWYDALVAAKAGNPGAVVMLGLVGDTGEPGAVCQPLDEDANAGAEASPRLRQFVQLFGATGVLGSVCESDYAPFFADAVATIDTACDEFEPPG